MRTVKSSLKCETCGYDLRAHVKEEKCPECGTDVKQSILHDERSEDGLSHRASGLIVASMLILHVLWNIGSYAIRTNTMSHEVSELFMGTWIVLLLFLVVTLAVNVRTASVFNVVLFSFGMVFSVLAVICNYYIWVLGWLGA